MIEAARVVIPVSSDAGKADTEFKKLNRTLGNTDQATKKTSSAFDALKKLGIAALAVQAARQIKQLAIEVVNVASAAEETRNKFNVTFQGITAAANQAATELANNYGLAQQESEALLANTGDLLTGFGFTRDSALDLSTQVQKLAVDLASFTNYSGGAQGASEALTAALLGERERMKALGIAITEADLQQLAKDRGITGELDRQTKAMLTLELAMRQSQNAIGDFARSESSFANQSRIAAANVTDLKTIIGSALLPIANVGKTRFNEMAGSLKEAATNVRDFITSADGAEKVGAAFGVIDGTAAALWSQLVTLKDEALDALQPAFDEVRSILEDFRGSGERTGLVFEILGKVFQTGIAGIRIFGVALAGAIENMRNLVEAARQSGQAVSTLARIFSKEVTFEDVRREFAEAGEAFRKFGREAAENFTDNIREIVEQVQSFGTESDESAKRLEEAYTAAANRTKETVTTALTQAGEAARGVIDDTAAREADLAAQAAAAAEELRRQQAEKEAEAAAARADLEAEFTQKLLEQSGDRIAILQKERDERIAEAEKIGADTSDIVKYYQNEINDVMAKAAADRQKMLEDELAAQQRLFSEQRDVYVEYLGSLTDDRRMWHEMALEDQRRAAEAQMALDEQTADRRAAIEDALGGIYEAFTDWRINLIDQQIAAVKASGEDEETIADAVAKLEHDKAVRQRTQAAASIAFSTGQAIMKAIADFGWPAGLVPAALIGAFGAAQEIELYSRPIPAAQFGGDLEVPPGFGNDSALLRVSSGERVSVSPARDSGSGGGLPDRLTLRIGQRDIDAVVDDALNKGSATIRRSSTVRVRP